MGLARLATQPVQRGIWSAIWHEQRQVQAGPVLRWDEPRRNQKGPVGGSNQPANKRQRLLVAVFLRLVDLRGHLNHLATSVEAFS
jgi:hypothetical protein